VSSARSGFTIIELIVAIVILVVGVLGLAGTAGMVSRMVGGAAHQTIAANVAASRFEALRSVPCAQVVGGTATTRGINEKWTVTADPGNAALWEVEDVVTYTAAGGRSRTLNFKSYVRCP
jgi:prepilin-type N-terminal cleavage/methylation domain-containing protein